jgi:hypothetical protein
MSDLTLVAETAKRWLRLNLRWEIGGGLMGFVSGVAVNTFFALAQYRAAELCAVLCLIILLSWVWVLSVSVLARGVAVALVTGTSLWIIYKLDATRTQSLKQDSMHKLAVLLSPTIHLRDRAAQFDRIR